MKGGTVAHKVLLIDDEPDFVEVIRGFLQDRGYEVAVACDGEDGLRQYDAASPDLVLLDLKMPKKDGYEFLKEIRANRKWVPVVIMSALSEPKNIFKGYEFEADYYLTKPINLESLSRVVLIMISLIPLRKR